LSQHNTSVLALRRHLGGFIVRVHECYEDEETRPTPPAALKCSVRLNVINTVYQYK